MRYLASCILVACSAPTKPAQPPSPAPVVAGADLREDLDILERAYRALHPGLYRYNSEADVDRLFDAARGELARSRSLGDSYLTLTRLTAAFRCGHSYPNPSNQAEAIAAKLTRAPRLPFWFRWIGGRMVVTRDFSGRLAVGSQIDAIDGVDTPAMLATLMPLARADGGNDVSRRAQLEVTGESMHEAFDVLAPLVYPHVFDGPDVDVVARGKRITVALQSAAAREAALPAAAPDGPLWHPELRADGVLYLRMPTWVAYKTKWDWKASLAQIAAIEARALVIDLRGNEGGSNVGDELAGFLIDKPIVRSSLARRVRFERVPDELRPYLDTWDPSFFELGVEGRDRADGWRELSAAGEEVIEPREPRFRGKVIVLVDGANSSATFQFAQLVQRAKLGTLVGTSTGGNQRGINGGAFFFVRLPRTKLEVDLPLIGTFADAAPDGGLTPDVLVETSARDIAAGHDPQLAKALELAAAR